MHTISTVPPANSKKCKIRSVEIMNNLENDSNPPLTRIIVPDNPLRHYPPDVCFSIVEDAVTYSLAKNMPNSDNFTPDMLDWFLNCVSMGLRSPNIQLFRQSFNLFSSWLQFPFEFTKLRAHYLVLFIRNITSIFDNPLFSSSYNGSFDFLEQFETAIRTMFLSNDRKEEDQVWMTFIDFLLLGSQIYSRSKEHDGDKFPVTFFNLALDAIIASNITESSFFQYFDQQLEVLFKTSKRFIILWINHFKNVYMQFIQNPEPTHKEQLNFFKSKIDTLFEPADKHKAFAKSIQCWQQKTNSSTLLVQDWWPTEDIKSRFWYQGGDCGPLLLLIIMGNSSKHPELQAQAEAVLSKTIKNKDFLLEANVCMFFMMNRSLILKMKDDLIIAARNNKPQSHANMRHIIPLLFTMYQVTQDQTIAKLIYTQLSDELTNWEVLFALLFANEPTAFWEHAEMMMSQMPHLKLYIFVVCALATLFGGQAYADSCQINAQVWQMLNDPDQHDILFIALFIISETTKYFKKNTKDTAKLLNENISSPYFSMLRLSLLGGGLYDSCDDEDLNGKYIEQYCNRRFIVSAIENHNLVIRHPLGKVLYKVNIVGQRSLHRQADDSIQYKEDPRTEENDLYTSEISDDSELFEKLKTFDNSISIPDTITPYFEPEENETPYAAHSMLYDFGFITSESSTRVKAVSTSQIYQIDRLDEISPSAEFQVPVYQVDSHGNITSNETERYNTLISDLNTKTTHSLVYQLNYVRGSVPLNEEQNQIMVLLNESNKYLNMQSPVLPKCECIFGITPYEDGYDKIEILGRSIVTGHIRLFVPRQKISDLIKVISFLFLTRESSQKANYVSGYEKREKLIASIYDKSQAGRAGVLYACRTCGQALASLD